MSQTELPTPVAFEITFVDEIKSAPPVAERLLSYSSPALTIQEITEKLAKAEEKRLALQTEAIQQKESRKTRREQSNTRDRQEQEDRPRKLAVKLQDRLELAETKRA